MRRQVIESYTTERATLTRLDRLRWWVRRDAIVEAAMTLTKQKFRDAAIRDNDASGILLKVQTFGAMRTMAGQRWDDDTTREIMRQARTISPTDDVPAEQQLARLYEEVTGEKPRPPRFR